MSRLLSLRNVSKIQPRHVPLSNTCQNASSTSRLVAFGNSRVTAGNAARNSSRFHTGPNSSASARTNGFNNQDKHLTAARLQLNLSNMQGQAHSKADEKGMPLLSELTAWVLQKVKVPKGELRVVDKVFDLSLACALSLAYYTERLAIGF